MVKPHNDCSTCALVVHILHTCVDTQHSCFSVALSSMCSFSKIADSSGWTACMAHSMQTASMHSMSVPVALPSPPGAHWQSVCNLGISMHSQPGLSSNFNGSRAVLLTPLDASPLDHAHSLADVCKLVRHLHQIYCWKDLFKGFHYHTSLPALMTYTKRYAEMGL